MYRARRVKKRGGKEEPAITTLRQLMIGDATKMPNKETRVTRKAVSGIHSIHPQHVLHTF